MDIYIYIYIYMASYLFLPNHDNQESGIRNQESGIRDQ